MGTYGTTTNTGNEKIRRDQVSKEIVRFRFPAILDDYYWARHAVDDNNNWRQGVLSLEESMATHSWLFRQFTFFLGLTEVNTYLAYNHFCRPGQPALHKRELRSILAKELLFNHWIRDRDEEEEQRRRSALRNVEHIQILLPPFKKFIDSRGGTADCKTKFKQLHCKTQGCDKTDERTYCRCDTLKPYCKQHFIEHVALSASGSSTGPF
jgi:hypothetical protein